MDISTIGLKVDASGVITATGKLDQFTAAGGRAEAAADALGDQAAQTSAQVKGLGTSAGDAAAKSDRLAAAALKNAAAAKSAGVSVGQYNAALRTLPAQLTDIFTGLTSGQSPFLVLIQQGGQLKDSFGGIVPAARALAGAISPLSIALAGVGAAIGTVAFGFVAGAKESRELERAILLTGNAAGVTGGQLAVMAQEIDKVVGTQAKASEVLGLFASTARIAGDSLQEFAQTAIQAERDLGISVEQVAKDFAELAKEPTQAAIKLNQSINFLTASTFQQIEALERAGRATEAAQIAQKAYNDAIQDRSAQSVENLGAYERAWIAIKAATVGAGAELLDYIKNIGRANNDEVRLAELRARRGDRPLGSQLGLAEGLSQGLSFPEISSGNRDNRAADEEERRLAARVGLLRDGAAAQAEINRRTQEAISAQQENQRISEALLSNQEKLRKETELYLANVEKQRKGGITIDDSQVQKDLENIRKKFADKPIKSIGFDIGAIQSELSAVSSAIANSERELEALRAGNRISDERYYSRKKELLLEAASAQQKAIREEIDRFEKERATGQARIDLNEKIAEAYAQLGIAQADAASKSRILDIQQDSALERQARQFAQAQAAAQDYLDTLARGYQRQIDDFGQGPAARRFSAGRNQIDDRTFQQRFQLEGQRTAGQVTQEQYDAQLAQIQSFHDQALAQWDSYYADLEEKSSDFSAGFNEAFLTYADSVKNVGNILGNEFVGAINSATEATSALITDMLLFGASGEDAAKKIALALVTDLVQSLVKVGLQMGVNFALQQAFGASSLAATAAAASSATSLWAPAAVSASIATLGAADSAGLTGYLAALAAGQAAASAGGLFGGAFANGGDPPLGHVSLVGERGPELFVPKTAGTIIPNPVTQQLLSKSGGGIKVNVTINPGSSETSANEGGIDEFGDRIVNIVIGTMINEFSDEGRSFKALQAKTGLRVIPR